MEMDHEIEESGSVWHRWDLHCHSPLDKRWNEHPPSDKNWVEYAERYIERVQATGIRVIAVTDHYTRRLQDGMLPVLQEVARGTAGSGSPVTVLPGFEISVRELSGIHVLVIFPEDIDLKLVDNLLARLHPPNVTPNESSRVPMSDKTLDQLHEELRTSRNADGSPLRFVIGFAHVTSKDKGVLGAPKGSNRLNVWRSRYVKFAQWSRDPRTYEKGFCHDVVTSETHEYHRKDIVHLIASDCCCFEAAGPADSSRVPIGGKSTWLKAEPTFEGLVQVLLDPKGRVYLGDENPGQRPKRFFTKVTLTGGKIFPDGDVQFTPTEIRLNRSLVAVIGGRGSGKSMLLDVFAKVHAPKAKRAEGRQGELAEMNLQPGTNVSFVKEDRGVVVSTPDDPKPVDYVHVHQGQVKSLCEEPNRFTTHIWELLQLPPLELGADLDEQIGIIVNSYFDAMVWLDEHPKKEYDTSISKLEKQIGILEDSRVADLSKVLREKQKRISNLKTGLQNITSLVGALNSFQANASSMLKKINEFVPPGMELKLPDFSTFNQKAQEGGEYLKKEIEQAEKAIKDAQGKLLKVGVSDPEYLAAEITRLTKEIEAKKQVLTEMNAKQKVVDETFRNLREIAGKMEERLQKNVRKVRAQWDRWRDRSDLTGEQRLLHQRIIDNIDIVVELHFDGGAFYSMVENTFNRTRFRKTSTSLSQDRLRDFLRVVDVESYFRLLRNEKIIVSRNSTGDPDMNLSELVSREEYFITDGAKKFLRNLFSSAEMCKYLKVVARPLFSSKEIKALSIGERGSLFLRLKLATAPFSTPLIFDQPEDDLDNDFIMSELVPLIKDIKVHRQVIVATHNANLVVNAGAELIISAQNSGETLTYQCGGIESQSIKDSVCNVLEGGEEALKLRYAKYGFEPPETWMIATSRGVSG
ncbi:MAG: TrlF family AAA-like ATPase [Promethearchaeota archaeon]